MQIAMRPTEATRLFTTLQQFTAPSWGAEQIQHAQLTVTGTQVRGAATDSHTAAIQRETLPTAPAEEGQFLVAPKQIKAFIAQARAATRAKLPTVTLEWDPLTLDGYPDVEGYIAADLSGGLHPATASVDPALLARFTAAAKANRATQLSFWQADPFGPFITQMGDRFLGALMPLRGTQERPDLDWFTRDL